ncbi:MAG: hypothetical protein ACKN9W_01745 [Methylococcus sp.]
MLAHKALSETASGKLTVNFRSPQLELLQESLHRNQRIMKRLIAGGSLLISGSLFMTTGALAGLGSIAAILGILLLGWAWLGP